MPRCHRLLNCAKPRRKDYPEAPKTLGEHLKRRRLDLALRQCEVAALIGVRSVETVGHWESGNHQPPVRLIPAIHRFLGLCPSDPAWTFGERLQAAREAQGLSRRRVASLVGVDEATVARAERDVRGMARRSLAIVSTLLRP